MLVWLTVAAALAAAPSADVHPPSEPAPVEASPWQSGDAQPLEGMYGVETAIRAMGADVGDVVVMKADFEPGSGAPVPSLANARAWTWRRLLGRDRFTVTEQRVTDGAIVSSSTSEGGDVDAPLDAGRDRMCTGSRRVDQRPIALQAVDQPVHGTDPSRPNLFLVEAPDQRTALVHLEPGESATVVEVVHGRHHARRMEIDRQGASLQVRETSAGQEVCIEVGDDPDVVRPHATPSPWGTPEE